MMNIRIPVLLISASLLMNHDRSFPPVHVVSGSSLSWSGSVFRLAGAIKVSSQGVLSRCAVKVCCTCFCTHTGEH